MRNRTPPSCITAWPAAVNGATFFLSHSNSGEIFAFDYEETGGAMSNRRLFATVPAELGIPDGAALDTEGGYWRRFTAAASFAAFTPWLGRPRHRPARQPAHDAAFA